MDGTIYNGIIGGGGEVGVAESARGTVHTTAGFGICARTEGLRCKVLRGSRIMTGVKQRGAGSTRGMSPGSRLATQL